MKTFKTFLVALSCLGLGLIPALSNAHEGDCPYCKLKLVQNTKEQDNEVVVKFGNKRIEYRCIYCVIKDQNRYKSDLLVYTPSDKIGEPIVLKRTNGKWTAPEGAVFLNTFKKHIDCSELSRGFSSKEALLTYAKKHNIENPRALSLPEFIDLVTKPNQ